RDEALLGAVVEVALQAAALAHRDLHEPRPRRLELFDPRAPLGLEALVLELQRGRGRGRADQARVVAQRGVVDDRADALAVTLDLGDGAAGGPRVRRRQVDPVAGVVDVVARGLAPVHE